MRPDERRLWDRVAAGTHPLRADGPPEGRLEGRPADRRPEGRPPPAADRAFRQERDPGDDPTPDLSTAEPERARLLRPVGPDRRSATSLGLAPPDAGPVGRPQAGLDRRTAERLRKGARVPDARIDLHGMTAERAHRACMRFLGEAVGRGHRVVLVITGKGGRGHADSHRGRGVLRDALPGWLRASPLGASIVGIYQAHRRHGGEGAFYVYLKRHR